LSFELATLHMNKSIASSRNLWPYAITAWFVLFGSAVAVWITFAVRQRMDLVRADYYEEEVHFQSQLDRLNRTAAMRSEVAIHYDATKRQVTLLLPATPPASRPAGQIHFYRPSNASLDFDVPLAVDAAGLQRIGTDALRGGLWKVRVQWTAAEKDCFFEQAIVVDESNPGIPGPPAKKG
jgi:nitrogen fixation protein FixH